MSQDRVRGGANYARRTLGPVACLFLALTFVGCAEPLPDLVNGQDDDLPAGSREFDQTLYNRANVVNGGQLYDKWWVLDTASYPQWGDSNQPQNHDLWPATNGNYSGSETWRCKNCHGWDYIGADGAYGSGQHFTGFRGIVRSNNFNMSYSTASQVFEFLANDVDHGFGRLTTSDLYDVTRFVMDMRQRANGQLPADFIDSAGQANGSATVGGNLYAHAAGRTTNNPVACETCHGANGEGMLEPGHSLGELSNDNPWEFAHKALFGHPKSSPTMPALLENNNYPAALDYAIDVLAYAQTVLGAGSGGGGGGSTGTFNATRYNGLGLQDLARGAQVYDKWWVLDPSYPQWGGTSQPAGTHTLWPNGSSFTNTSDTFRCKNCHGWDYRGADGAYGSGSHFTGIRGIINTQTFSMSYPTAEEVFGFLETNTAHDFGTRLTEDDLYAVTYFVMTMRSRATSILNRIDDTTKAADGNAALGADLYAHANGADTNNASACESCHGADGAAYDEPLAPLAQSNPWEFVHKALFGHPNSAPEMPALAVSNTQFNTALTYAVDILTYAQTAMVPDPVRGGRLYDKWWVVAEGATQPTQGHPIYLNEAADPNKFTDPNDGVPDSPESTWRCKECHGWDYKGNAGAYGTGSSHFTGFKGVLTLSSVLPNQEAVANFLTTGQVNVGGTSYSHEFGGAGRLSARDINDLAAFIVDAQNGVRDVDSDIAAGTASSGATVYGNSPGSCGNSACHDVNGLGVSGLDLNLIANDNPWEFIHKARFGHPNSAMIPGQTTVGYDGVTPQQAADVLSYVLADFSGGGGGGPVTYENASVVRGGRLFDKWFAEKAGATLPQNGDGSVQDNPHWALRAANASGQYYNARSGDTTWRCKECHGWDYRGRNGAYGPGSSHYTGFKSLQARAEQAGQAIEANDTATMQALIDIVSNRIQNGTTALIEGTPTTVHNFGQFLNDQDVMDLTKFVLEGQIRERQTSIIVDYIQDYVSLEGFTAGGSAIGVPKKGNAVSGQGLYEGPIPNPPQGITYCADSGCHGVNGDLLDFQDGDPATLPNTFVGDIARENPWEFIHKARFGHPGSPMPGFVGYGFTADDIADILTYAYQELNL